MINNIGKNTHVTVNTRIISKIGKNTYVAVNTRVISKVGKITHETACQHSFQSALVEPDVDSLPEKIDSVFTIY